MIINKNLYKYTAIISFTIVVMLVGNLIVPIFTMAKENSGNGFLNNLSFNQEEETLTVTGTLPDGFTSYKLYWTEGDIPVEKLPENATDEQKDQKIENAINWSISSNHLLTDVVSSNNKKIESTVKIKNDKTKDYKYNALCVATADDGSRMMQIVQKTIKAAVEVKNTITITLNAETNKININVKDPNYDITAIKFVKSDDNLTIDDFKTKGENLEFKSGKDVSITKYINAPGKYYVFAETTAGTKSIKSCLVQNVNNPVNILFAKKKDGNKVYINATTENSKITEVKYYIDDDLERAAQKVKDSGTTTSAIASVDVPDGKYIAVYAVDQLGYTRTKAVSTSAINKLDSIPWVKGEEEPEEELAEEPKQEEPKQEEPKQEEPKQEEPKQEEPKQEEPKQEEPKQEEPKQEEPKQEEPKQEEPKQEEPKQEEPKQEEPKQEEPKQEEPKQEESKQPIEVQDDVIEVKVDNKKNEEIVDDNGYIDIDSISEKETDKSAFSTIIDKINKANNEVKKEEIISNNENNNKNENVNNVTDKKVEIVNNESNKKNDTINTVADNNSKEKESNNSNSNNNIKAADIISGETFNGKENDSKKIDTVNTGKTDKVIPQAGTDNTFVYMAILFFAGISVASFIKYKTVNE